MRSQRPDSPNDDRRDYSSDIDLRDADLHVSGDEDFSWDDYERSRQDEWAEEPKSETPLWLKLSIGLVSIVIVISLLGGLAVPFLGGGQPSELPSSNRFQEADLVEVIDGRTIVVEMDGEKETVRYIGIEHFDIDSIWRQYAAEANLQLLSSGRITLESDALDRDESGRLLRYVYVGDIMVNGLLIRNGLGMLGPLRDGNDRYAAQMSGWSEAAQSEELGIWGDPLGRSIRN